MADIALIIASIIAVCVVGVAIMSKHDQKYPCNGKDLERCLRRTP